MPKNHKENGLKCLAGVFLYNSAPIQRNHRSCYLSKKLSEYCASHVSEVENKHIQMPCEKRELYLFPENKKMFLLKRMLY